MGRQLPRGQGGMKPETVAANGRQRGNEAVKKFIPKEKLGRKARKRLDSERRATWAFSPVTKKVESKKLYNRKTKAHARYDDSGMGFPNLAASGELSVKAGVRGRRPGPIPPALYGDFVFSVKFPA